ncbi:MAG TPA: helix-turn-helix domain-containing protein [Arenicellales bacterium]|nr:helix-turn-helix domain-containing protein [Arenicellales bacterium]
MTEEEQKGPIEVLGCGRQLRRTREKLGLSIDDVSAELRLSGFQIQALEDDDWSQLPGETYARGYVRSYARLLGLDADQLLSGASTQEIELSRGEPEIAIPAKEGREERHGRDDSEEAPAGGPPPGSSLGRILTTVVVVAVLAAAYWQYRGGMQGAGEVAETQESGLVVDAPSDAALPAIDEPVGDTDAFRDASEDDGVPATPSSPDRVVFEFRQRSWIDVRDAGGERLLYRSFPPGRRVEVEGRPPFSVYLGNARGVQVEYMGDIVRPQVETGRLYARLILDASSG